MHPPERREDPFESGEILKRLTALGYIENPGEDQKRAVEISIREAKYNLARSYLDAGEAAPAAELLNELVTQNPEFVRFSLPLAQCRYELGDLDGCQAIVDRVLADHPTNSAADLLLGSVQLARGRLSEALECFQRAEAANPRMSKLHTQLGRTYLRLRRWKQAERSFKKAIQIDGDSPRAHDGLACVFLAQNRARQAADEALIAVGLAHFFPEAHFHLGQALARLGQRERAVQALETSLAMRPGNRRCRELLKKLRAASETRAQS